MLNHDFRFQMSLIVFALTPYLLLSLALSPRIFICGLSRHSLNVVGLISLILWRYISIARSLFRTMRCLVLDSIFAIQSGTKQMLRSANKV